MRVLVYGFGPYRQFRENITTRIIKSLPKSAGLMTEIFPVRFQRRQFIAALTRHRPDIVLGLGQSSRNKIDVETRARNRRRARKSDELRAIFRDRPMSLPTTLKFHAGRSVRRSNDAGDYVCNYSMFLFLDAIGRAGGKARFGFIHIPHDWDPDEAVELVRRVLRQCRRPSKLTG
jgi:pyrrolidone-carboxylate peptidase